MKPWYVPFLLCLCLTAGCRTREFQLFSPKEDNGSQDADSQGEDLDEPEVPASGGAGGTQGESDGDMADGTDIDGGAGDNGLSDMDGSVSGERCSVAAGIYNGEFACTTSDGLLTVRGDISFVVSERAAETYEMVWFEDGPNMIQISLPSTENAPNPPVTASTLDIDGWASCGGFYASTKPLQLEELPMLDELLARLADLTTIDTLFMGQWDVSEPDVVSGNVFGVPCENCDPICEGTWSATRTQ